jgi:hypothetical protein
MGLTTASPGLRTSKPRISLGHHHEGVDLALDNGAGNPYFDQKVGCFIVLSNDGTILLARGIFQV